MNKKTVWITYADKRKDLSAAEKYGELRDVFSSVGRNYQGDKLIDHARTVLAKAQPGDYLLPIGDPTLVGICMGVWLENLEEVNVLRWDRDNYEYEPLTLNFSWKD